APSIRIVRSTVPDDIEDTVMRALEKVPADRFATVALFKEALLGSGTATTAVVRRATRRNTTSRLAMAEQEAIARGRRPYLIAAAVAVVIAVGGFAYSRFGGGTR